MDFAYLSFSISCLVCDPTILSFPSPAVTGLLLYINSAVIWLDILQLVNSTVICRLTWPLMNSRLQYLQGVGGPAVHVQLYCNRSLL